jgi:hypothetical protein
MEEARHAGRTRRNAPFVLLAVFGLVSLSYLLGAAVMFFQLPSSGFLSKSFVGARFWLERQDTVIPSTTDDEPALVGLVDKPGKAFDGFTLYSCSSTTVPSTQVFLVNMRPDVVHRWAVSFSHVWHNPPQLDGRQVKDADVCIVACHLYGNGDLLVVFHGNGRHAEGYGLAKLDRDSNVLWTYAAKTHHDVDVGEDGTIYTITQSSLAETPKGLEAVPPPWLIDHLVLLSPDGKERRKPISILEALRQSPFSPILCALEKPRKPSVLNGTAEQKVLDPIQPADVLHTNSVKVLGRALAPRFPMFKEGDVLVSIRQLNALVVLDPKTGAVTWAAQGPWKAQHDAQFLDNGHLLIFDNLGSPRSSRVLEFDPRTNRFPWSYPGLDDHTFFTNTRGLCQRLPNGNTLIVDSEQRMLVEVTPSGEVAWACSTHGYTNTARRYRAEQLSFLQTGQRARP